MKKKKELLLRPIMSMLVLLFFCYSAIAQQKTVSGKVSDGQTGEGIPGASVKVKGGATGAVTDLDGNFSISVEKGQTLVFSFIGYVGEEVVVGDENQLTVVLDSDLRSLESVVVTGYSVQAKKSITGAVSVVDIASAQELSDQSAIAAIQGRVSGVQIGKSGGPGGSNLIQIRGISNLTVSSPLFIIDGVQTNNGDIFNSINSDDIESIQVLKDASAAAIYGARANNGVIIVTTKRGKGEGGNAGQSGLKLDID